jgi:hypothetical protein
MLSLQEKEDKLYRDLLNLESKPIKHNIDYSPGINPSLIQRVNFPENKNYEAIATDNVGYAPSNLEIENNIYNSNTLYAYEPKYNPKIALPVNNPNVYYNPNLWAKEKDINQIRTSLYVTMPDQFERSYIMPSRDQKPIYFNKGYSGLSSEFINSELIDAPIRFKKIMKKHRELYKNFI